MSPDPLRDYLTAAIERAEAADDALVGEWLRALLTSGESINNDAAASSPNAAASSSHAEPPEHHHREFQPKCTS